MRSQAMHKEKRMKLVNVNSLGKACRNSRNKRQNSGPTLENGRKDLRFSEKTVTSIKHQFPSSTYHECHLGGPLTTSLPAQVSDRQGDGVLCDHKVAQEVNSWKIEGHSKPAETVETSGRTQVQRSKMDTKTYGFQTRQSKTMQS